MSKSGKHFSEKFYTEDYDQEMLDFIEENYDIDTCNGWYVKRSLIYHCDDNDFYVSEYLGHGKHLTKQEFKEKIGMVNKSTFTKDDLVAGKHVVECRNGNRYVLVAHDVLLGLNSTGWNTIDEFEENLVYEDNNCWDIMKVFEVEQRNLHTYEHLPIVWERTEKSEAQLQYEECQAKMKELQAQLDKLEPQIK